VPKQTFRKLDIAEEYLRVAAELYFEQRYFPALGIAAMAEEIFEAVMRARNEAHATAPIAGLRLMRNLYQPVSRDLIAGARALNPSMRRLKDVDVYRALYRVKNSSKHGTAARGKKGFELLIEADAELEAWSMLGRAVENYIRLHYEPQGAILKFFRQYQAGRKTSHHQGSSEGPHTEP
jgi:hypothetical protein